MVIKNFIMMNASDKGPVYEITCIDSLSQLYRVLKVQHNNGRKVIQYTNVISYLLSSSFLSSKRDKERETEVAAIVCRQD